MTTKEAIQNAIDSLSDESLKKLKLTRGEWIEGIKWLEAMGIYPDNDPRNEGKYDKTNDS